MPVLLHYVGCLLSGEMVPEISQKHDGLRVMPSFDIIVCPDCCFKYTPTGWWPSLSSYPCFGNIPNETLELSCGCLPFKTVKHLNYFVFWKKW